MAQANNDSNYTGEDLLRYARGQMTTQQMHALEKAALEDAFLADALDGYMGANANLKNIAEQNKIAEKLKAFKTNIGARENVKTTGRVIPRWRQKWLQYAVAASVLLAGGWWVLSLTQSPAPEKNTIVAQNESKEATLYDSVTTAAANTQRQNLPPANETEADISNNYKKDVLVKKEKPVAAPGLAKAQPYNTAPKLKSAAKEEAKILDKTTNDAVAANTTTAPLPVFKDQTNVQNAAGRNGVTQNNMPEANANNFAKINRYTFNGKVVDASNNPLPYSNVMIPGEDVGTYSDAKGNFNFVYVDSTLPVRARSLGHADQNFTMQADVKENRIVLQEDEELKNKMVVYRQQKQARNQVYKPTIVERDSLYSTSEPTVGWNNYNTYALNNSRAIELPAKRPVELSFDINKDGEVENVTVEKSQGKELDEEAIRLLKEGPKWKAKKGKSRAKVTLKL